MPQDIEQAFENAKASLFPAKRGDLITDCSYPDYSKPCKHLAAAHYILGGRFDEDPLLVFRIRGRTQEQMMQELRKRRVQIERGELVYIASQVDFLSGSNSSPWRISLNRAAVRVFQGQGASRSIQ